MNTETAGRFRFALVGAGVIGRHHGKVISELADQIELVAVVDHVLDRATELAAKRGGKAFTTLSETLGAVDVDVVWSAPRPARTPRSRSRHSRRAST
jgi:predicted dehydrogenase